MEVKMSEVKQHIPHTLGLRIAQDIAELIPNFYDEHFAWLEHSLEVFKESFSRPEMELLPKTPLVKKGRSRRKVASPVDEPEDVLNNSEESSRPTRKGRARGSRNKTAVTESTQQQMSSRAARAKKRELKEKEESPVFCMVKQTRNGRLEYKDIDVDKTPVGKQVNCVRSPSPVIDSATPKRTVQRKASVRDKAHAYEAMLAKRTSQSPASPRTPTSPLKSCSRTPTSVLSPGSPNTVTHMTRGRMNKNDSITTTPCTVTQLSRSTKLTAETDQKQDRRSSRKSLKVPASKIRLSSARGRASTGERKAETSSQQESENLEEQSKKRVRTRLRLKKKTATEDSVEKEEETTPQPQSSSCDSELSDPPVKKPCRETDHTPNNEPRLSYDKLYKEQTVEDPSEEEAVPRKRTKVRKAKTAPSEKVQVADSTESETEADTTTQHRTRTKTRKKVEAQREAVRSESESEVERPVRQSTRTKTRKAKQAEVSESSECSDALIPKKEQIDSNESVEKSSQKEVTAQSSDDIQMNDDDHDQDSGIMSARTSEVNNDISSKFTAVMEVDAIPEEEEEETETSRSTRTKTRKAKCASSEESGDQESKTVSKSTRTNIRKRHVEEEDQQSTAQNRPKRSCTNSVAVPDVPPKGFVWIEEQKLCLLGYPESDEEILFLLHNNIYYLICLSEDKRPWSEELTRVDMPVKKYSSPSVAQVEEFLQLFDQAEKDGRGVAVQSEEGLGRAGTMIACYFVKKGLSADDAMSKMRQLKHGSIEVSCQERFVVEYEKSLRKNVPEPESMESSEDEVCDRTLSPECPADKIIRPHARSFLNTLKKTPSIIGTPSNLMTGITSFIKRTHTTPNKASQQTLQELKQKELEEKQRKDQERLQKREENLRLKLEEQKKKREERMRKVQQYREMKEQRERQMKDTLAKKTEERLQVTDKLKEGKLKEEAELKAKIRLKKQQEAEDRRKQDEEEKLRRKQELEEENRRHLEFIQRKKEHEEQERQKKIAGERKRYEERMAEMEREREVEKQKIRQLEEERERDRQKMKEEREKAFAREKAERERQEIERKKDREAALAREIRILNEMEAARQQKDLERAEKQKEKEREMKQKYIQTVKHIHQNPLWPAFINTEPEKPAVKDSTFTSYELTPAKQSNYDIDNLNSDDSTDDEDRPKKTIPEWAQDKNLRAALINQLYHPPNLDKIFGFIEPPDLCVLFRKQRPRFNRRTSSAVWDSPMYKPHGSVH